MFHRTREQPMSNFDDDDYYSHRERIERELADRTSDPLLSKIHREMADLYSARAAQSAAISHRIFESSPGLS
jgi:hypothetical protein